MKKETEKLVKAAVAIQEDLGQMTVDTIESRAPTLEEAPVSLRERAKLEGVMYIEPKRKLPAIGKLPEKLQRHHAHDWEYVKAMYDNPKSNESIVFWLCKYPGDQDCQWEIPSNVAVYVPRMIAMHLSGERENLTGIQAMIYHTFDYKEIPTPYWRADDFTHQFSVVGTHSRGRMRPIGVFS